MPDTSLPVPGDHEVPEDDVPDPSFQVPDPAPPTRLSGARQDGPTGQATPGTGRAPRAARTQLVQRQRFFSGMGEERP